MISGEFGNAVLERVVAQQMDALIDGDGITATLVASCFSDALRKGVTPREVAKSLLHSLPADVEWEEDRRDRLREAIQEYEDGAAAA